MQSVDTSSIDHLLESWDRLLKDYPNMKRDLLINLGNQLLEDVRQVIGGTGKVQGWQERYVGSRNGYAAVRPKSKTFQSTRSGTRYAVGHITNAIENGHPHRRPRPTGRKGYKYRPRIRVAAVPGRHFYARVRGQLGNFGRADLERLAQEIARRLEGGT